MAGESETSGAAGGEFPVFKSSEGAFDRAKYEEQDKARTVSDGITARSTGKEIDEDLVKKKKSADQVIKEANKFYDDSFEKNLKGLDPAYDPSLIYYSEAYSDGGSNKNKIKRKLEKGETIDGKEIFEMSKQAAENKIGNALVLKDGRVTDILDNLGISDVKNFDLYEDVKSDFNDKIKDEKIKFEPLLDNFSKLLQYFTVKESSLASQYAPILHTPENMAIISALAKVLEAEGFTNESVTNMSKKYDENIKKLIEKKEGKKAEDVIKEAAQEAKKEEAKKSTEESKIEEKKEEKKEENKPGDLPKPEEKKEEVKVEEKKIEETKKTEETKGSEVKTAEQKLEEKKPEEKKDDTKGKAEDVKTEDKKGKKDKDTTPALSESNKGILEMLGLKMPAKEGDKKEGEGGDEKDKGKGKGTTTGSPAADKALEELGFVKPKEGSTDTKGKGSTDNKSKTEKKETKLDEKVSTNTDKKTETSSTNTPIKETVTQNLSSVTTPSAETKVEKKEEIKTTPTTTTENKTGDIKSETSSGVKTIESQQKESEDKTKKDDQDKMNKELGDNMKSMVALLTQLNNTMKNPLMVISNDKKFH